MGYEWIVLFPAPRPSQPLHGRDDLVAAASERFEARGGLLVLTGPPGSGKSRTAVEIAQRWTDRGGTVHWIPLQAARDVDDLTQAVAVAAAPRGPPVEDLPRAVESLGRCLLVLDDLEHLPREAHQQIAAIVRASPSLRVLGTSRSALRLPEEECLTVPPLPMPDRDAVLTSPAWQILRDAAPPGATDAATPQDALALLARLDGLPLALRLAGGRLEALSLGALQQKLEQPLLALVDPDEAHTRHGSLQRALEGSWALLGPTERACWTQLSVFRGAFDFAAAEAVIEVEGEALDALHLLVRRHLLARESGRLWMSSSIRAFGRSRLPDDELHRAFARHARFYASRATLATDPRGHDAIERDRAELAAVAERATQDPALADAGARCGLALSNTLSVRGDPAALDALAVRCQHIGEHSSDPTTIEYTCRILSAGAIARRRLNDYEGAKQILESAKRLAALTEDPQLESRLLVYFGDLHNHLGDPERARRCYEEALTGCDREERRALLLANLACTPPRATEEARAMMDLALRTLPDTAARGPYALEVRKRQGSLGLTMRDPATAREGYERAMEIALHLGHASAIPFVSRQLGQVLDVLEDRPEEALEYYARAIRETSQRADRVFEAAARLCRGRALVRLGRLPAAREDLDGAVRALTSFEGDTLAEARATLALIDALSGNPSPYTGDPLVAALIDGLAAAHEGRIQEAALRAREIGEALARTSTLSPGHERLIRHLQHVLALQGGTWVIARDGSWFSPPDGERVEIRSPATARILAALAAQRDQHPSVGLDTSALTAVGWPGEIVVPAAGANRVRVALSALRKTGIGPLIQRRTDGWLLDPDVPLLVAGSAES